jgi:hypothetical protein
MMLIWNAGERYYFLDFLFAFSSTGKSKSPHGLSAKLKRMMDTKTTMNNLRSFCGFMLWTVLHDCSSGNWVTTMCKKHCQESAIFSVSIFV